MKNPSSKKGPSEASGKLNETAQRILIEADRMFSERGFDAVSVRDIASAAAVNKALVFYYYASKEELFERVLERYYASHTAALNDAFNEQEGTLSERLHHLVDRYLDFIEDNLRYATLVQRQVMSGHAGIDPIQKGMRQMAKWFSDSLGSILPADGHLAASQFFISFSGMVINYFTYAPVLSGLLGADPLSAEQRAERRKHLHWMVDTVLGRLLAEQLPR